MPHLVILYTPNLEGKTDMSALCRALADTMLLQHDEAGKQVFPTGGTRVYAYPAAHYAVADGGRAGKTVNGSTDYAFVYLNLRMASGRSDATKKGAGDALLAGVKAHFDHLLQTSPLGITLNIDESPGQVYDGKLSSLHPLFQPPA
jgi:5-carboxymethyl-2-hydroxymuconate isomerase